MNLREVFVFASATPPQLITEAIQAMAFLDPPVYPDDIYVFSTETAKRRAVSRLIEGGVLASLCAEWDIPTVSFSEESFILLTDNSGESLDDIVTLEESESAGDRISVFLSELAAIPSTRLHCFLGGGRQTLTFYMGTAFQLVARQWDRMYHVSVSRGFERNDSFFYKPKQDMDIPTDGADGSRQFINTGNARIFLNELPLIYLRDKIPLSRQTSSFRSMISEGQRELEKAHVVMPVSLNLSERMLFFGNIKVVLTPLQLMVYSAFLRNKLDRCSHDKRDGCKGCSGCFITLVELTSSEAVDAMSRDYQALYGDDHYKKDILMEKWERNLDVEYLRQQISKINGAIRKTMPDESSAIAYQISAIRQYGRSRYGIRADRSKIRISNR